jgi:hypothetical protein
MNQPTPEHQLGAYIVRFQTLEEILNVILVLLADVKDREVITILVHELEFGRRVATADVLFSHVVRTKFPDQTGHIGAFHLMAEELVSLSKIRNTFAHSHYQPWIDITGRRGMVRWSSRLKPSKGIRLQEQASLVPSSFDEEIDDLKLMANRMLDFADLIAAWFKKNATPAD